VGLVYGLQFIRFSGNDMPLVRVHPKFGTYAARPRFSTYIDRAVQ